MHPAFFYGMNTLRFALAALCMFGCGSKPVAKQEATEAPKSSPATSEVVASQEKAPQVERQLLVPLPKLAEFTSGMRSLDKVLTVGLIKREYPEDDDDERKEHGDPMFGSVASDYRVLGKRKAKGDLVLVFDEGRAYLGFVPEARDEVWDVFVKDGAPIATRDGVTAESGTASRLVQINEANFAISEFHVKQHCSIGEGLCVEYDQVNPYQLERVRQQNIPAEEWVEVEAASINWHQPSGRVFIVGETDAPQAVKIVTPAGEELLFATGELGEYWSLAVFDLPGGKALYEIDDGLSGAGFFLMNEEGKVVSRQTVRIANLESCGGTKTLRVLPVLLGSKRLAIAIAHETDTEAWLYKRTTKPAVRTTVDWGAKGFSVAKVKRGKLVSVMDGEPKVETKPAKDATKVTEISTGSQNEESGPSSDDLN